MDDIFVKIYELAEEIHTDQTGAFPVTSQRGYWYIMVGIHIDAKNIFCKLIVTISTHGYLLVVT